MSYNVYRVEYSMAHIADPDVPRPCYHHVIFIETNPTSQSGFIHHVTGDITSGMVYARRPESPESLETFHAKYFLGAIDAAEYPDNVDSVLGKCPPPHPQKKFNVKTMRTEQMKPDGGFYEEGEERPPMFRCKQWILNSAIPALIREGFLRENLETNEVGFGE